VAVLGAESADQREHALEEVEAEPVAGSLRHLLVHFACVAFNYPANNALVISQPDHYPLGVDQKALQPPPEKLGVSFKVQVPS